jgi:hypothetical protein
MSLLTVLRIEALFVLALFLPLLVQLVALYLISRALWGFTRRFFGRGLWLVLALIGVPVHELSHAIAFVLTGAGVQRVVLFAPRGLPEYGGATGVVVPRRSPSTLSRLIASVAPFFGCSLAAWLVLRVLLPGLTLSQPAAALTLADLETTGLGQTAIGVLSGYLRGLVGAFTQLVWNDWRTFLALYLAASLGMGAAPSTEDFRLFFPAMLGLLALLLPIFAAIQVFGNAETALTTTRAVLGALIIPVGSALNYAALFALTALLALMALAPLRGLVRRR